MSQHDAGKTTREIQKRRTLMTLLPSRSAMPEKKIRTLSKQQN